MSKCHAHGMCKILGERCAPAGASGKGFRAVTTLNLKAKTGDPHAVQFCGVAYHADAKDRGLLINVCPWCGGKPGYYMNQQPEAQATA